MNDILTLMPVLIFLAMALISELCRRVGLFIVIGDWFIKIARGRVAVLWSGIVLLCVVTTTILSLDATAVLVSPVAIEIAQRGRRDPVPFAVTAIWLANTASLLLPVSNLTNLLA